jgi:chaperonin GroES
LQKPDGLNYGVIVEAGPGSYDNNGKIVPLAVKVGDKVLLPEFGGSKVKLG